MHFGYFENSLSQAYLQNRPSDLLHTCHVWCWGAKGSAALNLVRFDITAGLIWDPSHVISWGSRHKQNGDQRVATTCCGDTLQWEINYSRRLNEPRWVRRHFIFSENLRWDFKCLSTVACYLELASRRVFIVAWRHGQLLQEASLIGCCCWRARWVCEQFNPHIISRLQVLNSQLKL